MNPAFTFVLSSLLLTVAYAGTCIEQAECDEGTCCTGFPPFGGICKPLTPEGGKCHVVDKVVPMFGDFYVGTSCPCEEGLICVQQGKKKNDGICQMPPTTAAPTTEAPATEAPATEAPATEAPATEAPATEAPASDTSSEVDDTANSAADDANASNEASPEANDAADSVADDADASNLDDATPSEK